MSITEVEHHPVAHKRRAVRKGRQQVEVSVRCTCGGFQSAWRLDPREAAALYAGHVGNPS